MFWQPTHIPLTTTPEAIPTAVVEMDINPETVDTRAIQEIILLQLSRILRFLDSLVPVKIHLLSVLRLPILLLSLDLKSIVLTTMNIP